MNEAIRLRRVLIATLILTATMSSALPLEQASAATTATQGAHFRMRTTYASRSVCPIHWRRGTYQVKRLVRCAAHYYSVRADKALAVARRESRFRPRAYNAWSCAKGIYQHLCRYWRGRADRYGFRGWSAYNARANIIVTMRMVRRYGWQPWGG
jgi:soluble lytic murein transglycosylase-like protein